MKFSHYARKIGVGYSTALRWFHPSAIKGYQAPSGTIIFIYEPYPLSSPQERTAIYARVSSHEHKGNVERQAERLRQYCTARGYRFIMIVKEIASGVNDSRPKLLAWLDDPTITASSLW
jgi:putative resolvase